MGTAAVAGVVGPRLTYAAASAWVISSATACGASFGRNVTAPGRVTTCICEQASSVARSWSVNAPSPFSACRNQAGTPVSENCRPVGPRRGWAQPSPRRMTALHIPPGSRSTVCGASAGPDSTISQSVSMATTLGHTRSSVMRRLTQVTRPPGACQLVAAGGLRDHALMRLGPAIPALPVRDVATATRFWRDAIGFTARHEEPGFAIVTRNGVEIHLWKADDDAWRTRSDLVEKPVRSGAESFIAGTASCRIAVDDDVSLHLLHRDFAGAGVLHPTSTGGPIVTHYGMSEVHVLDADGNLVTFFAVSS